MYNFRWNIHYNIIVATLCTSQSAKSIVDSTHVTELGSFKGTGLDQLRPHYYEWLRLTGTRSLT